MYVCVCVFGATPIYFASQEGHVEVVQYLVATGADVNKAKNGGFTPLYIASEKGHDKVVQSLIAVRSRRQKGKQ